MVFEKYHQLWTACGRLCLFSARGAFQDARKPDEYRLFERGDFSLRNDSPVPKASALPNCATPRCYFLMIFLGFYIRSENLIFQADFLILNLCGVHVVVANFSWVS